MSLATSAGSGSSRCCFFERGGDAFAAGFTVSQPNFTP
jgi:hypothetical protein